MKKKNKIPDVIFKLILHLLPFSNTVQSGYAKQLTAKRKEY